MRIKFTLAASIAALAAPAVAAEPVDPRAEELVRALPAPEEMEAMGAVLGSAMEALMDVPVGPLLDAVDPERGRDFRGNETLGALAVEDDPYFRERMQDEIAAVGFGLGAMTERFAALAPVLVETMDDVQARMEEALDGLPER